MKTELFTVSKIFTESLFRIPDFQRGYSWGNNQLRDFWLDLQQLEKNGNHYTGVLTLEDVPESKWKKWDDDAWIIQSRRYKPYYIVDGQQRITTVIILIQCILETIKSDNLNFTPIADIRRKYIFDSKLEDSERSYIFGYEKDNPSYEYLKKTVFCEDSDIHLPDEVTIYTKNLLAAKMFFCEEISKLNEIELEELYTKVTQQLVFNVYEISDDIDVFVTFETMNNRGKPLSTLELLKNRLIYLSTKLKASSGREDTLRRKINDAWKSAYHYLGKNDQRPLKDDKFLETHLSYFYINNLVKLQLTTEEDNEKSFRRYVATMEEFSRFLLDRLFTPKRINVNEPLIDELPKLTREFIGEFSQHLKKSVELYFKLSTPSDSEFTDAEKIQLERIGRLLGHSPSPMLLAIYLRESNVAKRIKLLTMLERLVFCQSFGMRTSTLFRHTRSYGLEPYLKYATGEMTAEQVTTLLENIANEILKETPLSEVLNDWVKNGHGYYGWNTIKYFLYEYELSLKLKVKASRDKVNWKEFSTEVYDEDYETIEHIYPQKAKDSYWNDRFSKFTPTQKRLLRNSLGNLLPLSSPRNSSLGNKSFTEKLGDDNKMTGYKYGCYSENEITNYSEWDANAILNRGIHLLTFLETRWNLPIGDKNQKIKALGLGFMNTGL